MDFTNLYPVRMCCPNCGHKIVGYKGEDGAVRIDCPRCKVKIFSKQRNKRKINIEVTLPQQNMVNEYL